MKAPEWRQRVLFITNDPEIQNVVAPAFGAETELRVCPTSKEGMAELENGAFQVVILDLKTTDPALLYFEEKDDVSFLEISQFANQTNSGVVLILLVNKLVVKDSDFARKCGATLIMDRKDISIHRVRYVIRVLRKRTFRTLLFRDIPDQCTFDVPLFHYMPMSDRYVVYLQAGDPFDHDKRDKFILSYHRHLFVRESHFDAAMASLRKAGSSENTFSAELSAIRQQYRQWLIAFFDVSTDGMILFGKNLYDQGVALTKRIEQMIDRFPDPKTCLLELPYPRWSVIAHGINCAIYALIFCKQVGMAERYDVAVAALIHNIGQADIDQRILQKSEFEMSGEEFAEYKKHVYNSMDFLRRKHVPLPSVAAQAVLHHHENHDGTGFPGGLFGETLPKEAALLSMISSFDHVMTVRPGQKALSLSEAWERMKKIHEETTQLKRKFNPSLMARWAALLESESS